MDTWQKDLMHSVLGSPGAENAIAFLEQVEQAEREEADRRERVAERTLVHLGQMPLLAAAMAANARPLQEGGGSRPGSRLPSQLVGITALDELWTLLGNWATNVAARLGVEAPAAVKRHADRDVDVDGFRVWDSPTFRVGVVVEVSDWLRARHGDIQTLSLADEFNTNVDSEMRRWLALFPLEVPAQVLPRVCSTCGRLGSVTVLWSAADGHHDDYTVECSHCREVLASSLRAMKYHPDDCPGCVAAAESEGEKR